MSRLIYSMTAIFFCFLYSCGTFKNTFSRAPSNDSINCYSGLDKIKTELTVAGMTDPSDDLMKSVQSFFENGGCLHVLTKLEHDQIINGPPILIERLPKYGRAIYNNIYFNFLNDANIYKQFSDVITNKQAQIIMILGNGMVAAMVTDHNSDLDKYIQTLTQPEYNDPVKNRVPFFIFPNQFKISQPNIFLSTLIHEEVHIKDVFDGLPEQIDNKLEKISVHDSGYPDKDSVADLKDSARSFVMEARAHVVQSQFEKSLDNQFDEEVFLSDKMSRYADSLADKLNAAHKKESINQICAFLPTYIPKYTQIKVFQEHLPFCSKKGVTAKMKDFEVVCFGPGNVRCSNIGDSFTLRATYSKENEILKLQTFAVAIPNALTNLIQTNLKQKSNTVTYDECSCYFTLKREFNPK